MRNKEFKCPLNYKDPLCPKCKEDRPYMEKNCKEWRKKQHITACGCGGAYVCECGYSIELCMPNFERNMNERTLRYKILTDCAYCHRKAKWEPSMLWVSTSGDLDIVKAKEWPSD